MVAGDSVQGNTVLGLETRSATQPSFNTNQADVVWDYGRSHPLCPSVVIWFPHTSQGCFKAQSMLGQMSHQPDRESSDASSLSVSVSLHVLFSPSDLPVTYPFSSFKVSSILLFSESTVPTECQTPAVEWFTYYLSFFLSWDYGALQEKVIYHHTLVLQ